MDTLVSQRARLQVITADIFAEHAPEAQPEAPSRLTWAMAGIKIAAAGCAVDPADNATPCDPPIAYLTIAKPLPDQLLQAAHSQRYLDFLRSYAAGGGGPLSVDTDVTAASYLAAATASAAVWHGANTPRASATASLIVARPPGHHANATAGSGFCLINHVAVAAKLATSEGRRVAVVDWDVHHGNGTAEILAADPDCLYISLHEHPLYPYSGWISEAGSGPGLGKTVNVPLPGGLDDEQLDAAMRRIVLPCLRQHRPDLILVSAGQDGHWTDPLSTWRLTARAYHSMAATIRSVADEAGAVVTAVLEGGYSERGLTLGMAGIAAGLLGESLPTAAAHDSTPPRAGHHGRQQEAVATRLDAIAAFQSQYWRLG